MAQRSTGTILLVEDDADVREALAELLTGAGFAVECATNGEEAFSRLRWMGDCSLIILDLQMPVMNGWNFRALQLKLHAFTTLPVIIISGAGVPREEADLLQPAAYFEKPIDCARFLEAVARCSAGQSLQGASQSAPAPTGK